MKVWFLDLAKWLIIIAFAAAAFYIIVPKYTYKLLGNTISKQNTVTGKTLVIHDGNWREIGKRLDDNKTK